QIEWFESVLAHDRSHANIKTIVVGMHRALPNSYACGHSMNGDFGHESKEGIESGRRAYMDLVKWKKESGKFVYILASHSHFYMQDIFATEFWKNPAHGGAVLPGWIIGTAGAQRYALPEDVSAGILKQHKAETKVSGYLLGIVHPDGSIEFDFKKVKKGDVPDAVNKLYEEKFIKWCFDENYSGSPHPPAASCGEK
ncbi:MAG: hypothetical protein WBX38_03120, partial [Candidatus Sulfotelmatobacter sp.]